MEYSNYTKVIIDFDPNIWRINRKFHGYIDKYYAKLHLE